jgi:flagellar motor switch/type III secretory pathway protein FliN
MSESDESFSGVGDSIESQLVSQPTRNLETILRIPVSVQVVLGSAVMPVSNLLKLGRGAVSRLITVWGSRWISS